MTAGLFQTGDFKLASGERALWKIECDELTDGDLRTLARLLVRRVPPFSRVEGVPTGGFRIAEAMSGFCWSIGPVLIVDDVWTTGGSMRVHRAGRDAVGAVLFARGPVEDWVTPLFTMTPERSQACIA